MRNHPALIMVAPNGARKTKDNHPALPISPQECGATAAACHEAGADAIHLHVRNRDGGHILDAELYRQAIDAVRRQAGADMVVQITTEAVGLYQPAEQMAVVRDVRPAAFSVAVRELFPNEAGEQAAAEFLSWCAAERIAAQFILYAPEDVATFLSLHQRGLVPGDHHALLFVLGRYAADLESDPNDLRGFLAELDQAEGRDRFTWMMCAFGHSETAAAAAALAMGGHVRVGFENSLWAADGSVRPSNEASVADMRAIADRLARPRPGTEATLGILGYPD